MLGIKTDRRPIKGVFAEKLREQIVIVRNNRSCEQKIVRAKPSEESKK